MSRNLNDKCIKATLRNNDFTKVKVEFSNGYWTPEQFTCVFMAILESYTLGLLQTNEREDVYKHFNNAFGTFLAKILSEGTGWPLLSKTTSSSPTPSSPAIFTNPPKGIALKQKWVSCFVFL